MKDANKLNPEALSMLMGDYYDLNRSSTSNEKIESKTPSSELKIQKGKVLCVHSEAINSQEKQFQLKVMAAVGVNGQEVLSHAQSLEQLQAEDIAQLYDIPKLFVWGECLQEFQLDLFSSTFDHEMTILQLPPIREVMETVDLKRKLWSLMKTMSF